MTHDEMIAVIAAHKEGKQIECRLLGTDLWKPSTPKWNFDCCEYRIKPEPREWYIAVSKDGTPYSAVYNEIEAAIKSWGDNPEVTITKVREVLDE